MQLLNSKSSETHIISKSLLMSTPIEELELNITMLLNQTISNGNFTAINFNLTTHCL